MATGLMSPFDRSDKCLDLSATGRDLIDVCLRRDADLNRLLAGTRIFAADLERPAHRISTDDWLTLIGNCRQQVAAADLAFLMAEAMLANPAHVFFQMLQSAPNLARALRLWQTYRSEFLPLLHINLYAEQRGLALHLLPALGLGKQQRFVIQLYLSLLMGLVRHQLGSKAGIDIALSELEPADQLLYHSHWPVAPTQMPGFDRVLIPYPLLQRPFAEHDPQACQRHRQTCRARAQGRYRCMGLLEYVRRQQRRALPDNQSLEQAAQHLALSPSSLKRLLHTQGTSFGELSDQVRASLALNLLSEHHWPNRKVAQHLGYANEHNFRRAFKRWTGFTPSTLG